MSLFRILQIYHVADDGTSDRPLLDGQDNYLESGEVIRLACKRLAPGGPPEFASARFARQQVKKGKVYKLETIDVSPEADDGTVNLTARMPRHRFPDIADMVIGDDFSDGFAMPALYKPPYDKYVARAIIPYGGGVFGISEDHVAFEGETLAWPRELIACSATVDGGGNVTVLERPRGAFWFLFHDPSGSLRIKYHIGLPWFQGTNVIIAYTVAVPHQTAPPAPVDGLTDWTLEGPADEPFYADGRGVSR